jgi:hypothetical protein
MEIKRFFEQQVSVHAERIRRASSGLDRSQDRDRLRIYQSLLAAAKDGNLTQESFEKELSGKDGDKGAVLATELQSLPSALFREEISSSYEGWKKEQPAPAQA